jgi:hypothetical protein
MKNRFKAISGAVALTFMLLFGVVAFANTTNRSMPSPNLSSAPKQLSRNDRRAIRRHRRHHRHRHMQGLARRENQETRRDLRKNR